MAKNVLIGWPNRAPGAVLSGGSWTTLGNLNNSDYWRVARSTSTSTSNTAINIDIGRATDLRVVALAAHNLSLSATWRIKLGTTAGSGDVYDSGSVAVWAMTFGGAYSWADQFAWDGAGGADDYTGSPYLACLPLPTQYNARYARVEITDTSNPAGYVQIGKLFIGGGIQPAIGAGYGGLSESWVDGSERIAGFSLEESFLARRRLRQAQCQFQHLDAGYEFRALYEMQRRQGLSGEVLFLPEPTSVAECQRRGFLGRLAELSEIEYPHYRHRSMTVRIKETP